MTADLVARLLAAADENPDMAALLLEASDVARFVDQRLPSVFMTQVAAVDEARAVADTLRELLHERFPKLTLEPFPWETEP